MQGLIFYPLQVQLGEVNFGIVKQEGCVHQPKCCVAIKLAPRLPYLPCVCPNRSSRQQAALVVALTTNPCTCYIVATLSVSQRAFVTV